MEEILLVDCTEIDSKGVSDYLLDAHEYGCHYDHTVLQIEDDGNPFAEWLKSKGYVFKYHNDPRKHRSWDMIALYGT
jgi:hypothetical protein